MKKWIILLALVALVFTGCSSKQESDNTTAQTEGADQTAEKEVTVLKVGATPVPHAEILNLVKDDLLAQGIQLEVVEFTDYVKPNLSLNDGEIDANFFQHVPYLNTFNEEHKFNLVSAGTVHVEPLGLYSDKLESIDALEDGSTIAIPSDAVNGGRALILLSDNGLIKLSEDAGLEATEKDIIENTKGLKFISVEAAQLPRVLQDVDAAVINGNYAIEAGINPAEDALILEGAESPYANIITVRNGDENREDIKLLIQALQTEKVKNFILENYNGGVVPAF